MRKLMWFTVGFAASNVVGAYMFRSKGLLILAVAAAALWVLLMLFRQHPVLSRLKAVLFGLSVGAVVFFMYDA